MHMIQRNRLLLNLGILIQLLCCGIQVEFADQVIKFTVELQEKRF